MKQHAYKAYAAYQHCPSAWKENRHHCRQLNAKQSRPADVSSQQRVAEEPRHQHTMEDMSGQLLASPLHKGSGFGQGKVACPRWRPQVLESACVLPWPPSLLLQSIHRNNADTLKMTEHFEARHNNNSSHPLYLTVSVTTGPGSSAPPLGFYTSHYLFAAAIPASPYRRE